MKKIIIAIMAFFLVGTIFASSKQQYKITKETKSSTPGFNFQVEKFSINSNSSATAKARAPGKSARVRSYAQIDGYHDITIQNTTNKTQNYELSYTLTCEESKGSYTRWVNVYPGGSYSESDHSFGTVQKSSPGRYSITATTGVGAGDASASDSDHGTLTISK